MDTERPKSNDLQRLIRAARVGGGISDRPSAEVLARYLTGTTSEEEQLSVHEALLRSSELRRELLSIAKEVEGLADAREVSPEATSDLRILDFESFVKKYQMKVPTAGDVTQAKSVGKRPGLKRQSRWQSTLDWLGNRLVPRVYVPAIVTAATITVVSIGVSTGWFGGDTGRWAKTEWSLSSGGVPPELLLSKRDRSAVAPSEQMYDSTAEDAALDALSKIIVFRGGELVLLTERSMPRPADSLRKVKIRFLTQEGAVSKESTLFIPSEAGGSPAATLWALAWPTRDLYQCALKNDEIEVVWTSAMGQIGCFVISYPVRPGIFVATPPTVIQM